LQQQQHPCSQQQQGQPLQLATGHPTGYLQRITQQHMTQVGKPFVWVWCTQAINRVVLRWLTTIIHGPI
jgi:hypothetical protein